MKKSIFPLLSLLLLSATVAFGQGREAIEWSAAAPPAPLSVEGDPQLVETPLGMAVQFNGKPDGVFVEANPLAGLRQFTLEVIFKPDGDGPFAQRFLHIGTAAERVLFETRVDPDGMWYFDAHSQLPEDKGRLTLIDKELRHPTDRWYNVTLVCTGTQLTTYVDGTPQRWGPLRWVPFSTGVASVGVRQNRVDYFKGAILRVRVTPRALNPADFLKDYEILNE